MASQQQGALCPPSGVWYVKPTNFTNAIKREEGILVVRNWRDVTPVVRHESKIFRSQDAAGLDEHEAVLLGFSGLTRHCLQGGLTGDYHPGQGQMKVDGALCEVREGDAVHISPKVKHQLANTGDYGVEHLIISAQVAG